MYHANNLVGQGCGDSRNPRIQKFTWNADGTPNFGTPTPINVPQTPAGRRVSARIDYHTVFFLTHEKDYS